MKSSKQNFTFKKPTQLYQVPMLEFTITNKQDLRDIITDYIIHHLQQYPKTSKLYKLKKNSIKYPSITIKLNINTQIRQIKLNLITILQRYLAYYKKSINTHPCLQPLIVDILNFIDEIQDKTTNLILLLKNSNNIEQQILNLLIQNYQNQKQKNKQLSLFKQLQEKTILKHTSVSFIQIGNQCKRKSKQFLIQINQIDHFKINDHNDSYGQQKKVMNLDVMDKMDQLIQSGQLFQNYQKIQQLKKQKLIQFYQSTESEYQSNRQKLSNKSQQQNDNNFSPQFTKMLKDWLIEIDLSQKYYDQKYNKPLIKKTRNYSLDNNQQPKISQPIA